MDRIYSGIAKVVIGRVVTLVNKLKFELIAINLIVLSGLGGRAKTHNENDWFTALLSQVKSLLFV